MWVVDAKSLLSSTNCVENCPGESIDFRPVLEYNHFENTLEHLDTKQFQVNEFAYSGLLTNSTMVLNYLDMQVAKKLISEGELDHQNEVLRRTYL